MAFYESPFEAEIVNKRWAVAKSQISFHGQGVIYFTNGGKLEAEWAQGIALQEKFTFKDGLVYSQDNWDYCSPSDRRFYSERVNGFLPGAPQLANESGSPTMPIMTENGYAYFDHGDGQIHSFDGDVLGPATPDQLSWIHSRA